MIRTDKHRSNMKRNKQNLISSFGTKKLELIMQVKNIVICAWSIANLKQRQRNQRRSTSKWNYFARSAQYFDFYLLLEC